VRAIRYRSFGPPEVLEVVDVDAPEPAAGEIKVRVAAASLNPLDWKIRDGHLRLVPVLARPPRGTGTDFAGEIVAIGGGPGPRHVGERVFGSLSPFGRQGSCAEFITVPAHHAVAVPQSLTFEQAATLPLAGGTAVQALADDARLTAGQRVLVTGGAGGVGHFAVRFAKHLGAHVSATCGPSNVEFVSGLGADRVIDYTRTDVLACGETFDLVFDAVRAGGAGRAGAVSLILNADEAGSLGVLQVDDASQVRDLDTVFVSVFLHDLSRALERSGERTRRIEWLREWLPPLVREVEARAGSAERLGDEYLVYRLAPGSGSPRVSAAAPRPSPSPTR